jgi:DNA-binding response OmpR family regulator
MTTSDKLLVVDDEATIRFVLEETLARDGYEVLTAESGAAALALLNAHHFALALLDLKLKDMEGTDVLSALRRQSPDTVVIMLTAHASVESAVAALRLGAYDYLFKPCKTDEIRACVRAGLLKRQAELSRQDGALPGADHGRPLSAEAARTPARLLQRGGLFIDFERHVVTLNGRPLELSPTEFSLLAYLAAAAPRVVPAQELVSQVRGYDATSADAQDVLRFHIHRLRRKLRQAAGSLDLIRNVRGVGYVADLE